MAGQYRGTNIQELDHASLNNSCGCIAILVFWEKKENTCHLVERREPQEEDPRGA